MKNTLLVHSTILCILVLISCSEPNTPRIGNSNGVFVGKLTMYDPTGGHPVNGTISIKQDNSNSLSGNWSLNNGQSGKLVGTIKNAKITVNLNPDMVDANTNLIGDFDGNSIKGQWYFSGEPGVLNRGTFIATNI